MGKLTDLVHCFDDSVFFQLPGAAVSADGEAVGIGIGQAEEIIGQDAVEIPEVDEDTLGKSIRGDCNFDAVRGIREFGGDIGSYPLEMLWGYLHLYLAHDEIAAFVIEIHIEIGAVDVIA